MGVPYRFPARIQFPEGHGCWLWTGFTNDKGYGYCKVKGRRVPIHRVIYEQLVGPIPEGLTIDHLCRVKNCVNPDHLEPVSMRENILRGTSPIALNARKSHCKQGHPFEGDNLYLAPSGGRACWICKRASYRAWRRRKADAAVLRAELAE